MVSIVGGYSAFDHFRTENTFRYGNDDQFHRRMNHLIDFHTSTTIHAHIFILFLMDTQSLARSYTFYWILFSFLWNLLYFFLLFVIIFLVKNNCKSHLFSIKLDWILSNVTTTVFAPQTIFPMLCTSTQPSASAVVMSMDIFSLANFILLIFYFSQRHTNIPKKFSDNCV